LAATAGLLHQGGVPVPQVADLRAAEHSVNGALAGRHLLFADADNHQRHAGRQLNASLQAMARGLPHHREAFAARSLQFAIGDPAALIQGEAQVASQGAGLPLGREGLTQTRS
jgi:hypothetical protein